LGERILWYGIQGLLLVSILFTMSRSAIVLTILAGTLVLFPKGLLRLRHLTILASVALCVGFIFMVQPDFFEMLWDRARGGIGRDDGSVRNRTAVYAAAFDLIAKHGLWGLGPGNSAQALWDSGSVGDIRMHIHSVPLIVLLELGIFGLSAYLCGWLLLARSLWKRYRTADNETGRRTAYTYLMLAGICFAMLAVQPLSRLSLFPFLAGAALGPCRRIAASTHTYPAASTNDYKSLAWLAAGAVGLVVVVNGFTFQRTATMVEELGDRMAEGISSLEAFNFDLAQGKFEAVATGTWTRGDAMSVPDPLELPYYEHAARLVGLPRLFAEIGFENSNVDPVGLASACAGKSALLAGEVDEAIQWFSKAEQRGSEYGVGVFFCAEALWGRGHYKQALSLYARAAQLGESRTPAQPLEPILSLNERLRQLREEEPNNQNQMLEAAMGLRQLGQWEQALERYSEVLERSPASAEALFNWGVGLGLQGDSAGALEFYERAIASAPQHYAAQKRVAALGMQVEGGDTP
jgi:tetratricopeptide (TPR) repeat protein